MAAWELLTGEQVNERMDNRNWKNSTDNLIFEFHLDSKGVGDDNHIMFFLNYPPKSLAYNDFSYYLFFEKRLLRPKTEIDTLIDEVQPTSFKINDLDRSYIFCLIKMLLKNARLHDSQLSQQFVTNIAEQLLLLFMVNKSEETPQVKLTPVNRYNLIAINFVDQVKEHVRKHKAVRYYADKLGVAEKTLNKATQITLKITPKDLIGEILAKEAMTLLEHTDKSVKEISYELGIKETNNFSSFFKKITNMTPSEYRHLKNQSKSP